MKIKNWISIFFSINFKTNSVVFFCSKKLDFENKLKIKKLSEGKAESGISVTLYGYLMCAIPKNIEQTNMRKNPKLNNFEHILLVKIRPINIF
jgi:hypothetical protein